MREKKEINVEVGHRVRQAREAAGLTQERFAELIGISPQNVSCVERGLAGVSLTVLRRMCEILHVSSDYLLMGEHINNRADAIAHRLEQLPPEQFRVVQEVINSVLELTALPEEKKGSVAKCSFQTQAGNMCMKKVSENRRLGGSR